MIATMKVISIINLSIGGLAILACGFADEPLISILVKLPGLTPCLTGEMSIPC